MKRINKVCETLNSKLVEVGLETYTPIEASTEQLLHNLLIQLSDRRTSLVCASVDDKPVVSIRQMLADLLLLRGGFDFKNRKDKEHEPT